jgi:predicted metalloprotease with PDZ domain
MAGIEANGWRLDYSNLPSAVSPPGFSYSLGFWLSEDGTVGDVRAGSATDRAGIGPGMKLIGINGRHFTSARLHEAVARTTSAVQAIELLVENGDYLRTFRVAYQGGERYPHLIRVEGRPDLFAQVLKPRAALR